MFELLSSEPRFDLGLALAGTVSIPTSFHCTASTCHRNKRMACEAFTAF